jgi:hypothetical protein
VIERDFQDAVIELFRMHRWRVAHFRVARTTKGWRTPMIGDPGYPDLTMARGPRLVYAELKGDGADGKRRGRVTPDERAWLAELQLVAEANPLVEVYTWWPSDWEQIIEVARRRLPSAR